MPSNSYKVNVSKKDPVTTTGHKSYSNDSGRGHQNGSSASGGSRTGGDGGETGTGSGRRRTGAGNTTESSTGKVSGKASPGDERWRLNYVPTPYDSSTKIDGEGLEVRRVEHLESGASDEDEDRGHWGSKAEFLLSCIGLSVGVGNVWRFPYLAYQNGGSAFLFPYIILLVLIGKPMYLMETALGQYSQLGPLNVWRCAPVMSGVGVGMVILSLITSVYYNQLMAYTLYYMFATFAHIGYEVPWASCDPSWADEHCYSSSGFFPCSKYNLTESSADINCTNRNVSSATQYWRNRVLRIDPNGLQTPGDIGVVHWDLTLCLLLSWMIVFFCLMKGVKSSGKVVYFTATFPYVILIALLIVGVRLPGASMGLKFLFVPRFHEILDIDVWRKAAEQMFFSLSVSWGGLIMFGSYNKFRNKVHIDAMFVAVLDFVTSLIASTAIFSVLGSMALELGFDDIKSLAADGPGLAFIAYPEAISRTLPIPHLWAILFFFMLFTLGLDSEFALLETFLTSMYDTVPATRRYKIPLTAVVCFSCFLLGIPLCSSMGQYIFFLMDYFGGGIGVLLLAIFELIALHWVYGVRRFSDDMHFMLGYRPGMFWKVCWAFIAPVTLTVLFVYSAVLWKNPRYGGKDGVEYPDWAIGVGWGLGCISVGMVPLFFVIVVLKRLFTGKIRDVFKPADSWGPGDPEARRLLAAATIEQEAKNGIDNPALDHRF